MTAQAPPSATAAAEQPWYAAYPVAQSTPVSTSRSEVLGMLQSGKPDENRFVLVDLRRTDYEVRRRRLRGTV